MASRGLAGLRTFWPPEENPEIARLLRLPSTDAAPAPPPAFPAWLRRVSPTWHWDWPHLVHLQRQLARVTSGELRRLILCLPPRHGKSQLVTVRYSVYRLSLDPTLRVIIGAYNQTLAEKFSRDARRIAERALSLSKERGTAGDWEGAEGGGG